MNSDQVAVIRYSFAKITPIAEEAAALFYGRLFEIAPEVKPLFQGDMKEQGRKLMATLALVVNGLADLETILPAASALAKKHLAYGSRRSTMHRSALRCCGRWNVDLERNGRPTSPPRGRTPTRCCPIT